MDIDANKRDIKITAVSKNLSSVEHTTIANYTNNSPNSSSIPAIVQLNEDEFIVLWQQYDKYQQAQAMQYVKVDGQGKPLSKVHTKDGAILTYMQPFYKDGQIIWYINEEHNKYFYTLDVSDL